MTISPEPFPQKEPVRDRPTSARWQSRRSWRSLKGMSVASTVMMEPLSSWGGMWASSRLWMGVPATTRSSKTAWLESTSAPMVYGFPSSSTTREAEPMPPFRPWQRIPRPAPTAPSAKSARQSASAALTFSSVTWRPRMSLRPLSLHSQTTGLTLPVVSQMSGFLSSIYFTSAVSTVPTLRVLVKRMGVSSVPSSSIWTRPVVLPKPLMTWLAAITLSWKISP